MTAVVDETGAVEERYAYTPYGEVTILDASFSPRSGNESDISNEYLYTGRRRDPETGLQLNRNRFYASHLGRWVNRDPIGYIGGINLYNYVGNHPLIGTDPDGEFLWVTVIVGVGLWWLATDIPNANAPGPNDRPRAIDPDLSLRPHETVGVLCVIAGIEQWLTGAAECPLDPEDDSCRLDDNPFQNIPELDPEEVPQLEPPNSPWEGPWRDPEEEFDLGNLGPHEDPLDDTWPFDEDTWPIGDDDTWPFD